MKKIIIYQENSEPLILLDDDSSDRIDYAKKMSEILESSKVCILETTFQTISIKPSKINSISVFEVENKIEKSLDLKEVDEKKEIHEDVIKD